MINSAVHEIDVMPWLFGRDVVRVNWMSPVPPATGRLRDPQVVILELEGRQVKAKAFAGTKTKSEAMRVKFP